MNIRDLQYLAAVADHLHFGKAAASCNVSQPTLSMQLKKLEEYLGVLLFERTNKTVLLTPVGSAIAQRARNLLQEASHIREIAALAKDPFAGEVRLGLFPTLAPYLLPALMPPLGEAFPKLDLLLVEEKTAGLVDKLKAGDLDCALLAMPLHEEGLGALELFHEPFLLAVSRSHRLAKHASVDFVDVRNETMLLLEEGHCLREQALEACNSIGADEARNFRATSMETLLHMVSAGHNVTLVPRLAARKDDRRLRYIPFNGHAPSRTIGMYFRTTSPRAALFHKMAKIIKEVESVNPAYGGNQD